MNDVARLRLHNQFISRPAPGDAASMVSWMGAVQAQEFGPARWALGLRLGATAKDDVVAKAIDEGRILRTHVMRPTWHFVTPADIHWMLELTAPRIHRTMATYHRQLELDRAVFRKATRVFERALRDRQYLTRAELAERLSRARLPMRGVRLAHLALYAEIERLICSGPYRGKKATYALLDERAPKPARLSRDEALGELARRYIQSHAPATLRDFGWWSGLRTADARRGLEVARARSRPIGNLSYWMFDEARLRATRTRVDLLPIYDEYVVAYRDRVAIPLATYSMTWAPRAGVTFQHALVVDGQVAGTWRVRREKSVPTIDVYPLRPLSGPERDQLARAVDRYGRFHDQQVTHVVQ